MMGRMLSSVVWMWVLLSGCVEGLDEPTLSSEAEVVNASRELESLLNQHRVQRSLSPIHVSPSLQAVAEAHVRDLEEHYPELPCSLHSWSDAGPWTSCCYEQDNPIVECMINKPAELTGYPGRGYEIAVSLHGRTQLTPELALELWEASAPHHNVIVNSGEWRKTKWRAYGAAMSKHYAVIWFGEVPEGANSPWWSEKP